LPQVNTAQIANTQFNNGTGNGCNCVKFDNGVLTINGSAVVNGTIQEGQATLNISEFYSVFPINYCYGSYLPSWNASDAKAVITDCKSPSLSRRFDLTNIVEDALKQLGDSLNTTLDLDDLDWPNEVTNAFQFPQRAGNGMVAIYLIGLSSLILATSSAFLGIFREGRKTVIFLLVTSIVSVAAVQSPPLANIA
jgi:hypothetical protein